MSWLYFLGIWFLIGVALYSLFLGYRYLVNEIAYRRRIRARLRKIDWEGP